MFSGRALRQRATSAEALVDADVINEGARTITVDITETIRELDELDDVLATTHRNQARRSITRRASRPGALNNLAMLRRAWLTAEPTTSSTLSTPAPRQLHSVDGRLGRALLSRARAISELAAPAEGPSVDS